MSKGRSKGPRRADGASFAASFDSSRGNAADADYSRFSAVDIQYVLGDFGNGAGRMVTHDDGEPDEDMIMELVSSRERGRLLLDTSKLTADFEHSPRTTSLVKLFSLLADRCDMPRHAIKLVVRAKATKGAGPAPDYVRILNKNMSRPVEFPSPFKEIGADHDARISRAVNEAEQATPNMSESDKEILRERTRAEADGQAMDAGQLKDDGSIDDIWRRVNDEARDLGARDRIENFNGLIFSITDGSCEAPVLTAASREPRSLRLSLGMPKLACNTKVAAATMHIRQAQPLPGQNDVGEWATLVDWMDEAEWRYMNGFFFTVKLNGKAQGASNFYLEPDTLYQIKSTFVYAVPGVGLQESDATSITVRTKQARGAQGGGVAAAAAAGAATPTAQDGDSVRKRKREAARSTSVRFSGPAGKRSTPAGAKGATATGASAAATADLDDDCYNPVNEAAIPSAEVNLVSLEKAQLLFALQQVRAFCLGGGLCALAIALERPVCAVRWMGSLSADSLVCTLRWSSARSLIPSLSSIRS